MKNLQVVVSGGYRTGSTFVFSALVEIFKRLYYLDWFDWGVRLNIELQGAQNTRPGVFKSHDFYPTEEGKYKIIHTTRSYFDILSSLKKVRPPLPDYMAEVKAIAVRDKSFKPGKDLLVLEYSKFFNNELQAIEDILNFLEIDYSQPEKIWLANKLSYRNVKHVTDILDPINPTPYMARHISDDPAPGNYLKYLDDDEVKELTEFLHDLNREES